MKKIFLFLLFNFFVLSIVNSIDTETCIEKKPNVKEDCNKIKFTEKDESKHEIACCFVKYSSSDEGKVTKCVPVYKTTNGLHMYNEQLKNMGATSISIDCYAKRDIISLLTLISLILIF